MKVISLTIAILLSGSPALSAQDGDPAKSALARCGTAPKIDPWLLEFARHGADYPDTGSDTLYVGVQVHLVGRDNGTGRFSPERVLDAFCRLNQDFAASNIRFYFKNDWNLLSNTGWFQHTQIEPGIQMMFTNNVPDAHNAYFVSNPAGNCGYNLPYAGVAIGHSCAGPNDHTWAHEVGHALSLAHPFIGWEGKVYNPNTPTPDTLTYDYTHFHSKPDTIVPAPLDTALVEYLDGSNCGKAADLLCDTKPDYLSYGWACDGQNKSLVQQKDPGGAPFYSDGSLFMSYSVDQCQSRFSDEQIAAMRANLLIKKSAWLAGGPQGADIATTPALLMPIDDQPAPAVGAVLHWTPVPGATHYVVQVSRLGNFSLKDIDIVVADTILTAGALLPNLGYYWRVRPFNPGNACTVFSTVAKFKTVPVSGVNSAAPAGWRCYPTLLYPGQALQVEMPGQWLNQSGIFRVYDSAGRLYWVSAAQLADRRLDLPLPSANWPAGVYFLTFSGYWGIARQTLVLEQ